MYISCIYYTCNAILVYVSCILSFFPEFPRFSLIFLASPFFRMLRKQLVMPQCSTWALCGDSAGNW